jgi:hypothetical protein
MAKLNTFLTHHMHQILVSAGDRRQWHNILTQSATVSSYYCYVLTPCYIALTLDKAS